MRFLVLLLLVFSPLSYAWTKLPHMVIASIAYDNLKPHVAQNINTLVAALNKEYPRINTFLDLSNWADEIREEEVSAFTRWHFIDQSWSADGVPIQNLVTTDNAIWAIGVSSPVVQNKQVSLPDRARFLAFLTHIVGDIHQPLHASTRFSKNHRHGDLGGNEYKIIYQGTSESIHYFWDDGVTYFRAEPTSQKAMEMAKHIMQDYPKSYFGPQVDDLDQNDWAQESLTIAKNFVYNAAEQSTPSAAYIAAGKKIAEQRVALAGYRLAALLNQLLN